MELIAEVFGVFAVQNVLGMSPVVVLRSEDGRILPIYIGISEAMAIYSALKGQTPPRPMTHDLLVEVFTRLSARVEKIVIDDLVENTFYARLIVKQDGHELEIDARPSDSIAVAVRLACPIFVEDKVLDEAGNEELPDNYIEFDQIV
ncbi:MAG TPA: bifunctional nuclease family protein [Archaeoglobaceae archaeon]|nr:bifunctional nuclease family protein [Archaeoglobaceae archaeon]